MKIVIDIDENVFTRLFDNGVNTSLEDRKAIDQAVRNGKLYEERPKGKWEYNQYDGNPNIGNWHCSECKYIDYGGGYNQKPHYNFCPTCGADMRYKKGNNEIRWTDKLSVTSNGDIINFEGRVVSHINLNDNREEKNEKSLL